MSAWKGGRVLDVLFSRGQNLYTRLHSFVYRSTDGRVWGSYRRKSVLLLTTRGRRTGKQRTTPLVYMEDGRRIIVVASNSGAERHPAWWLNLRDAGEAVVEISGRKTFVRAEPAGSGEREELWHRLVTMYPGYSDYQRKTDRELPVVILCPVEPRPFERR